MDLGFHLADFTWDRPAAGLGIGAAWFEAEALGLGLLFPPLAERFARLEETLQICRQMWSGTDQPYEGQYYQLGRTLNVPAPLSGPETFLMVGGIGEQKTLRLVAQYATPRSATGEVKNVGRGRT